MEGNNLIINGSHFTGVLNAIEFSLFNNLKLTEIELLCDCENELYCIYTLDGNLLW